MRIARARDRLIDVTSAWISRTLRAVEAKVGLTGSGLAVAVLSVLVFLVAARAGNRALFMLTYGGVVVIGLAYLLARRNVVLSTTRSQLPTRVRAGQTVTVRLALESRRSLSTVVVEERLDEQLGPPVRVPVAAAGPGEAITHEYSFTPGLRGVYRVGPLVAQWSDPFGLTKRTALLSEPVDLIVHPRTEPAQDRVFAREWEDPPVRPPVTRPWPTGYEFYGLRDYVHGDDPRRIVWRATARSLDIENATGRYLVRESEQGITDRVSLLLDTDRSAHSPGHPSETFETAVKVVASLATRHVKDGFTVTAFTNADRLGRPVRSQRDTIRFLDELARLQPGPERLLAGAERILRDPRRDTHLAIVTPYLDAATTGRIKLLQDRGISIVLVLVVWDDTDPLTLHRAAQLRCHIVEVTATTPLDAVFRHMIDAQVLSR